MPFSKLGKYDPVPSQQEALLESKTDGLVDDTEFDSEHICNRCIRTAHDRTRSQRVVRVFAVANVVLFLILLGTLVGVLKKSTQVFPENYTPPWSKVRDDGYLKWTTKQFLDRPIFQSEPSEEVDAAWQKVADHPNAIGIPLEFAHKHGLPRSVAASLNTSIQVYGIAALHQYHCLNMVRKAFYPSRYTHTGLDLDPGFLSFHKDHCLDVLAQVIECKADTSFVYWWNANFTTTLEDGTTRDSDYYNSLTPRQREEQSFIMWDVNHQCQDFDLVMEWMEENKIEKNFNL